MDPSKEIWHGISVARKIGVRRDASREAKSVAGQWYARVLDVNRSRPPTDLVGRGVVSMLVEQTQTAPTRMLFSVISYDRQARQQLAHSEIDQALMCLRAMLEGKISAEFLEVRIDKPWCPQMESQPVVSYRLFNHIWWTCPTERWFFDRLYAYADVSVPAIHVVQGDSVSYTGTYFIASVLLGFRSKKAPAKPRAPIVGVHVTPTRQWPNLFSIPDLGETFGFHGEVMMDRDRGRSRVLTINPWEPTGAAVGGPVSAPGEYCDSHCRHCWEPL